MRYLRFAELGPFWQTGPLSREKKLDFATLFSWADRGYSVATAVRDRCVGIWAAWRLLLVHAYDPELLYTGRRRHEEFVSDSHRDSTACRFLRLDTMGPRSILPIPIRRNCRNRWRCSFAPDTLVPKMNCDYDKYPYVAIAPGSTGCEIGWEQSCTRLYRFAGGRIICIECYPGVFEDDICRAIEDLDLIRSQLSGFAAR